MSVLTGEDLLEQGGMKIDRRKMLLGGMAVLGSVALSPLASLPARAAVIRGTAYKAPGCGCCELWADHMREAGFEIRMLEDSDLAVRKIRHGITSDLASCHTALIEGYVVEGHVPASVVRRLLKERPHLESMPSDLLLCGGLSSSSSFGMGRFIRN